MSWRQRLETSEKNRSQRPTRPDRKSRLKLSPAPLAKTDNNSLPLSTFWVWTISVANKNMVFLYPTRRQVISSSSLFAFCQAASCGSTRRIAQTIRSRGGKKGERVTREVSHRQGMSTGSFLAGGLGPPVVPRCRFFFGRESSPIKINYRKKRHAYSGLSTGDSAFFVGGPLDNSKSGPEIPPLTLKATWGDESGRAGVSVTPYFFHGQPWRNV